MTLSAKETHVGFFENTRGVCVDTEDIITRDVHSLIRQLP